MRNRGAALRAVGADRLGFARRRQSSSTPRPPSEGEKGVVSAVGRGRVLQACSSHVGMVTALAIEQKRIQHRRRPLSSFLRGGVGMLIYRIDAVAGSPQGEAAAVGPGCR